MANQTVYPYGTNGSLPSSVGIINDLTTGGSDKALSAQQGVILKEMIDKKIVNLKYVLSDLTLNSGYLNGVEGSTISAPSSGSSLRYSDPFLVNEGDIIVVKTAGSSIAVICTTDASGSSYYAVAGKSYATAEEVNTIHEYSYVAESDGYIAISGRVANLECSVYNLNTVYIRHTFGDYDDSVFSSKVLYDIMMPDDESAATKELGYIDSDGAVGEASVTYKYTISANNYVKVVASIGNHNATDSYAVAFYRGEPGPTTLIQDGSIRFSSYSTGGNHVFSADVPTECTTIVVVSRTEYFGWIKLFTSEDLVRFGDLNVNDDEYEKALISVFAKQNNGTSTISISNSDFRAIFFSDIHNDIPAFQRIINTAIELYSENNIDTIINAGDTAFNMSTEDYTWFNSLVEASPVDVLSAVGNHDISSDKSVPYDNLISPVLQKSDDIIQPDDASTNYYLFYYKDYGNVRVVILYTGLDDEVQLLWLNSVLADAVENDKHIILVNHYTFGGGEANMLFDSASDFFANVDNTFMSSAGTIQNKWTYGDALAGKAPIPTTYLTAVKNFEDAGGQFICWLTGHIHYDHFYDVIDHDRYGYQPMFNTATARTNFGARDFIKNYDDHTKDCYNYIAVDTTQKMLKIKRIGCNLDVLGRPRNVLTYSYDAHKIVANY